MRLNSVSGSKQAPDGATTYYADDPGYLCSKLDSVQRCVDDRKDVAASLLREVVFSSPHGSRGRPRLPLTDVSSLPTAKRELWEGKSAIVKRLESLRLTIHERPAQVQPVTAGIPRLGFIVFPEHRRLKARKASGSDAAPHGTIRRLASRSRQLCGIRRRSSGLDQPRALRRYLGVAKARAGPVHLAVKIFVPSLRSARVNSVSPLKRSAPQ